nr:hypothetical protein [Micromonospora provocatoris]
MSCSGATTEDILYGGDGALGIALPPQVNAVTSATALVTVQIGGNDIGFSGIISDCARRA